MSEVLPDLFLPRRQNQNWKFSGIDSRESCVNLDHFLNYPYSIDYQYNSRGFRDSEWPNSIQELQNSVWCLGDSFTVGIGVPIDHTWVKILEKKLSKRCINVSLDGGSNDWIARRAGQILSDVRPTTMIFHWSYIERREKPTQQNDEDRRAQEFIYTEAENVINLQKNIALVEQFNQTSFLIHSTIPRFSEYQATQQMIFKHHVDQNRVVPYFDCIDRARDFHHYDKITAEFFVDKILEKITNK